MMNSSITYMQEALALAKRAYQEDEVPVGAVVVFENRIIGSGYNRREATNSPSSHAEFIAIENASRFLNSWRLEECQLYVTLEPCIMCCGAILQSRIPQLFFGTRDPKAGAVVSLYSLLNDDRLNHCVTVHEGILAQDSSRLLKDFFQNIRKKQKLQKKII